MAVTIEQLYQRLKAQGLPVPASIAKFRQQVWTMTRSGVISPPERRPNPGGGRGKTGFYADDTYDKVVQAIKARHYISDGHPASANRTGPQLRLLALGFELPVPLASQVEALTNEGYRADLIVLKGVEWLLKAPPRVRKALVAKFIEEYQITAKEASNPKRLFEGNWGIVAALTLADIGFKKAEELAELFGVSVQDILGERTISFHVKDGQVFASAIKEEDRPLHDAVDTSREDDE